MTEPDMDIEAEAASDLSGNLVGLLGRSAPEIRSDRRTRLGDVLVSEDMDLIPKITRSYAWVDDQPAAEGGAELRCLSEALYFEARGESATGVFAVAEVVLNRVDSVRYPDTVCEVINQGTGMLHKCQFSYNCDGIAEIVREPVAYGRMAKIARVMLDGARRELTGGAMFYHTIAVHPYWASSFDRTVTIGRHHFYARS